MKRKLFSYQSKPWNHFSIPFDYFFPHGKRPSAEIVSLPPIFTRGIIERTINHQGFFSFRMFCDADNLIGMIISFYRFVVTIDRTRGYHTEEVWGILVTIFVITAFQKGEGMIIPVIPSWISLGRTEKSIFMPLLLQSFRTLGSSEPWEV